MNMLQRIGQAAKRLVVRNEAKIPWYLRPEGERDNYLRHGNTNSGALVTVETALRVSTVYACVRLLAEDSSTLPLKLYKKRADGGRDEVSNHWVAKLIRKPNPWQNGIDFRLMWRTHMELDGNFVAIKTMDGDEVAELIPVEPHLRKIEWDRRAQAVVYKVYFEKVGVWSVVPNNLIFHDRGFSLNGYEGISPISYQREIIGAHMKLTSYSNRLFKNGALIQGTLTHPGVGEPLSDEAAKRIRESFEELYQGEDNWWKVALLEEGMTYTPMSMTASDAQYLEIRKYTRTEICAIFRVPPHKVMDLERGTFSNIEQQTLEYVQSSLMSRLVMSEERMREQLLPPDMQEDFYFKHEVKALLRGDTKTRESWYKTMVSLGIYNRNEVRVMEDENPGPAELDKFLDPQFLTGKQGQGNTTNEDTTPSGN